VDGVGATNIDPVGAHRRSVRTSPFAAVRLQTSSSDSKADRTSAPRAPREPSDLLDLVPHIIDQDVAHAAAGRRESNLHLDAPCSVLVRHHVAFVDEARSTMLSGISGS